MTDRLPWPLEGLGLFTGNSHNILIAGPEGPGKTSNACTILSHLLSTGGLKRLTVISPALAASSTKTDFNWLKLVPSELCEFIPISALSDDPVENYETLEEAYAPCLGGWGCIVTDDLGAKFTTVHVQMPEGDIVTLARYNYIKSCETSSKNTFILTLVHSTICGSNQDYNAMYRGHLHRVFYATLDSELDKIGKSYKGWRPGVRRAFAALKIKTKPHTKKFHGVPLELPIPELWNRFVYFNGLTNAVHYMYY
jgi:hypothetical protein